MAFGSVATNLVAGGTTAGVTNVYRHDRATGTTALASVPTSGSVTASVSFPAISADGRYVAFSSSAPNLVVGDTNGLSDIFLRDMAAGTTERVSVPAAGGESNGNSLISSVSGDGRYVAFSSSASNLVAEDTNNAGDVFVRDRAAATTTRVSVSSAGSQANDWSDHPVISPDGRYVAFDSPSSSFTPSSDFGGVDLFERDHQREDHAVSRSATFGEINANSSNATAPRISSDGRYVVFQSEREDHVASDTNGVQDVFIHDTGFTSCGVDPVCLLGPEPTSDTAGLEGFYPYRRWELGTGTAFVNMATGNLVVQYADLDVSGQGLNLRLTRTYNSQRDALDGPLGKGWTLGVADGADLVESLVASAASLDLGRGVEFLGSEDQFDFFDADATRHHFVKGGLAGPGWHSPPGVNLVLSETLDASGRWYTLTRPDGVRYEVRRVGLGYRLTRIADRRGNALTFSYASEQLQSITDAAGRSLTFAWSGKYLSRARFQVGTQILDTTYSVDPATARLTSVTEASGTSSQRTTGFSYSTSGLQTVTDARGRRPPSPRPPEG